MTEPIDDATPDTQRARASRSDHTYSPYLSSADRRPVRPNPVRPFILSNPALCPPYLTELPKRGHDGSLRRLRKDSCWPPEPTERAKLTRGFLIDDYELQPPVAVAGSPVGEVGGEAKTLEIKIVLPHVPVSTLAERSITGATLSLAAFLAAGVREEARNEWIGEQIAAESGETRTAVRRMCFSLDLVRAAAKIRAERLAAPGVSVIDYLVRSEARTRNVVGAGVVATAFYIFHVQGLASVFADVESLLAEGGALYGAARWRRRTLKERDEIMGGRNRPDEPD